jgi:hypothetical protein
LLHSWNVWISWNVDRPKELAAAKAFGCCWEAWDARSRVEIEEWRLEDGGVWLFVWLCLKRQGEGAVVRVCNFRATVLQNFFFFFSVYSTFFYLNQTSLVWWGLIDFSITKPNQTGSVFNILIGLTDFFLVSVFSIIFFILSVSFSSLPSY